MAKAGFFSNDTRFVAGATAAFGAAFAAVRFIANDKTLDLRFRQIHAAGWAGQVRLKFSISCVSWDHGFVMS